MTLDELYNLSKDECIERIKGESRSQAKRRLLLGAIFSILIIALLIFICIWRGRVRILPICQLSVFLLAAVWETVSDYRLLKRVDSLDTPEQLLQSYEKTMKNHRNAYYLGMLGLIGNLVDPYAIIRGEWDWVLINLILVVAMLAFLIYSYFKGDYAKYKTDRDEEIIMRLHDLIDMK